MTARVAAVVLAAGKSTRAGSTINKLLLPFGDTTLLGQVLKTLRRSKVSEIIIVTGYQAQRITPMARAALYGTGKPWRIVHARDFDKGLSASLKAGIRAVDRQAQGALVMLGDMPLILPEVVDQLIENQRPGDRAVVPARRTGKWGNPVILSRTLFPKVMRLTGDQGARPLLKRMKGRIRLVPMADPAIEVDIDRKGDLERLSR